MGARRVAPRPDVYVSRLPRFAATWQACMRLRPAGRASTAWGGATSAGDPIRRSTHSQMLCSLSSVFCLLSLSLSSVFCLSVFLSSCLLSSVRELSIAISFAFDLCYLEKEKEKKRKRKEIESIPRHFKDTFRYIHSDSDLPQIFAC